MPPKKKRPVYTRIGNIKPLGKSRLVKRAKPRPWKPFKITSYQLRDRLPRAEGLVIHRRPSGRPDIALDPRELRAVSLSKVRGTLPERIFYKQLRKRRLSPDRDFDFQSSLLGGRLQLGGIVADFLFPLWRLIVRIQGPTHGTRVQTLKDQQQRQLLNDMGWVVYDLPVEIVYDMMALEDWMRRHIDRHPSLGGRQVVGQTLFLATGEMAFAWTAQENARIARLEDAVNLLLSGMDNVPANAISTINGLSDINLNLGLVRAGEFRVGNNKNPGDGFTGVRMGFPAFVYNAEDWHIAGVSNDVLQFGLRATDGKALAGAGAVVLDATGITATAGTIGGWVLGSDSIKDAGGVVGMLSTVTGGDDIRFFAGHVTPGSAPFRVTEAGALFASSATITGTITATTGAIGGFDIAATTLSAGTTHIVLDAGNKAIYINDTTFGNAGIQLEYNAGTPRFYMGDGSGDYFQYDGSILTLNGCVLSAIATGSELSVQGWQFDGAFSATDLDTVAWGGGTLTFLSGDAFSIDAGNTGNMAATTYIYFDKATSQTVLQTSTTPSDAVGVNKVLMCVAKNSTNNALFQVFGGTGGILITTENLEDLLITTGKIVDAAVEEVKIGSLAVTSAKIATGAVLTAKLAAAAVETDKIKDGAVEEVKIGSLAVTSAKIATSAVLTAKLAAAAVETDKIKDGAVTTDKILANTIVAGDIAADTITAAEIAVGTITTTEIAANTIVAGDIAAGAIETDELAANAVTSAKIAANTIVAGDIFAGTITTTEIAANTIVAGNIAADTITAAEIAVGTITTTEIAANTIVAGDIAAGAIETDELAANAVTSAKIAANTIVAGDIFAGTITTTEIAANTIVAGDIAGNTITAAEIAANTITANEIAANTITAGQIAASAVDTDELAANAVTAGKINVSDLSAINADLGTITAGTINMYADTWDVDATGFRLTADEIASQTAGTETMLLTGAGAAFAAGTVVLDSTGITIDEGASQANWVKWEDSGSRVGDIYAYFVSADHPQTHVTSGAPGASGHDLGVVFLNAYAEDGVGGGNLTTLQVSRDNTDAGGLILQLTAYYNGEATAYPLKIYDSSLGFIFNDDGLDRSIRAESLNYPYMFYLDAYNDAVKIGTASVGTIAYFSNTIIVFNEEGLDRDFRVETDGNANMLFVDGGTNRVGIGTDSPDSAFHIKAGTSGTVGSHPAGQLIIQNPTDSVFSNVVITAYESDGDGNPDQQLWYLGSSSSSNTDIIFLNRRNAKLALGTSGISRITILGSGNVGIGTATPIGLLDVFINAAGFDANSQLRLSNQGDTLNDTYSGTLFATRTSAGQEGKTWIGVKQTANFGRHDIIFLIDAVADDNTVALTDEVMRITNAGSVGIGTTVPDGTLHVHTATAGAVTANPVADDLVVEYSGDGGISLLAPDAQTSYYAFGSPNDNLGAYLSYKRSTAILKLSTAIGTGQVWFHVADQVEAMRIEASGQVIIAIGGGVSSDGTLHVHTASAGAIAASANADDLVIENSDSGGITILTPADKIGGIYFGDPGSNIAAGVIYDHANTRMNFSVETANIFRLYPTGIHSLLPIKIKESAAAVADSATYGQLWVKNEAPCELWFTDDVGGEVQLGAGSGYTEGCRVRNSDPVTIANNTDTMLTFDTERWDTDGIHSVIADTGRLTCQTAGKYYITGTLKFNPDSDGNRGIKIKMNAGNTPLASQFFPNTGANSTYLSVGTVYDLEVGDYVTLWCYHLAGGNLDILVEEATSPEFAMHRIG